MSVKSVSAKNASLNRASAAKEDEFYTQLSDIENELRHYERHFKGKTILCNCDDPRISNFFHYFSHNFEKLGLKKLIATCYKNQQVNLFSEHKDNKAIYQEYDGNRNNRIPDYNEIQVHHLEEDGDFRSEECINILKKSDIVVTNPPFSLFREYVLQLMEYKKRFLIIGNQNAAIYKEIFPLIKDNKVWFGYHVGDMEFKVPSRTKPRASRYWQDETGQKWRSLGTICWFTNLDIKKRHESLILTQAYDPEEHPHYDNYDAINIDRVANIPSDYKGVMGVPITFLTNHSPEQFEIIGLDRYVEDNPSYGHRFKLNGKQTYARVLIRQREAGSRQ